MISPFHGSCLCGSVRFEVDRFASEAAHCHCSMCRKFHGAAYATFASVAVGDLRWTAGEAALQGYTADNGTTRTFCRHCGSSLTFVTPLHPEAVEVALGAFDDPLPLRPVARIFVDSAANWAVPRDELPRHRGEWGSGPGGAG